MPAPPPDPSGDAPAPRTAAVQVVSFDWPWPPHYGGVIDVYSRLRALLREGVRVHLHVVTHAPALSPPPPELAAGELTVFWHERRGWRSAISPLPYVVASRRAPTLLPQLAAGPRLILFEGIHTTGFLAHPRLAGHVQWVRVHNVESDYYAALARGEPSTARRYYYATEARRLARYEPRTLAAADLLLPISPADAEWCERLAPGRVVPHTAYGLRERVSVPPGRGSLALFHAGLHVRDNVDSALFLAGIFARLPEWEFVVAGRRPPPDLLHAAARQANLRVVADPSDAELRDLIRDAHVLALHSGHEHGFKLKLLDSLCAGRHVVANDAMVYGAPGLRELLAARANSPEEWASALRGLRDRAPSASEIEERRRTLAPYLPPALGAVLVEKVRDVTFNTN